MKNKGVFDAVRSMVKKIPQGKVSTYGNVAQALGIVNPRVIGWALKGNQDKSIPCHRVVQKGGTLSPGFSLDGWEEQRRRLEQDGLLFDGRQIRNFETRFFDLRIYAVASGNQNI
ncbi:MAG: MGMT family protein [Patescibacteria group bacterium]|jgi:methylated-DNA-protein-cysteine methyltransferase-like protein